MSLTEDAVRESLKQVIDPELFVNIVDLGLIYLITLDEAGNETSDDDDKADDDGADDEKSDGEKSDGEKSDQDKSDADKINVTIEMTLTSPACPAGPQLVQNSRDVVSRMEGVGEVEIKIVMIPPWTPDCMTEDAKDQLGIF